MKFASVKDEHVIALGVTVNYTMPDKNNQPFVPDKVQATFISGQLETVRVSGRYWIHKQGRVGKTVLAQYFHPVELGLGLGPVFVREALEKILNIRENPMNPMEKWAETAVKKIAEASNGTV